MKTCLEALAQDFFRQDLNQFAGVLAVSGGPDSVALARLLLAQEHPPLIIAHLNHLLRGPDSDADEAFVIEQARSWGLPVRTARIDVAAEAKRQSDNLENSARRLRYDWLTQIARAEQAGWVATGHTADDQAETILHRLLRGAGMQGLGGMWQTRGLTPEIRLVRPLLTVRRCEVLQYLAEIGQPFREDASNLDPRFTRNRLRQVVLPLLVQFQPAIVEHLCALASEARELYAEVVLRAHQLLHDSELPRAGACIVLDTQTLVHAPRHILREMFRSLWQREGWPLQDMDRTAWEKLAAVAWGELPAWDLPGSLCVQRKNHVVQVVQH
ncbi:MAG: tRNA lysidine(34) synthetase TilS [Gemmataceae bacterium]|nr:tRNA lysidine(34) synthetase TilS [Gemmataceae bacterium]MCI0740133.1 tRNA lysidine(34) synthetase TilS [Gemmataceae bacterium]